MEVRLGDLCSGKTSGVTPECVLIVMVGEAALFS